MVEQVRRWVPLTDGNPKCLGQGPFDSFIPSNLAFFSPEASQSSLCHGPRCLRNSSEHARRARPHCALFRVLHAREPI